MRERENRWELVNQRGEYDETERLAVPGGWLYRVILTPVAENAPLNVNVVFVPRERD